MYDTPSQKHADVGVANGTVAVLVIYDCDKTRFGFSLTVYGEEGMVAGTRGIWSFASTVRKQRGECRPHFFSSLFWCRTQTTDGR